jgi:hypothetical protein
LMEAAEPQHRFGNELEAHLEPLEVPFCGAYVILAEDAELMLGYAEDHVGVDPRIGVSQTRLLGPVKRLGGDKNLEIAGRMIVLSECQIRSKKAQGRANQNFSETEMGHSKGSGVRTHAPLLRGVIGNEDNFFGGLPRMYRRWRGCPQRAAPRLRTLRFDGIAHKLLDASDRFVNPRVMIDQGLGRFTGRARR